MLIVLHHWATQKDVEQVEEVISSMGLRPVAIPGAERTAVGVIGNQGWVDDGPLREIKGVREVIHVTKPYKLVSRDFHPADTSVRLGRRVRVGGKSGLLIIAGPCAVESREQVFKTARFLKGLGVPVLRGGAFKPRTSPHSFQGMKGEGLDILQDAGREVGILTATEVMSPEQVEKVAAKVDILQVGARNMQNYDLLNEVGRARKPVILKRGLSATVEEWLASAEYILLGGNEDVVLCERGIRTFEPATRNTADVAVIPLIKSISHLPVIFDPSHAAGRRDLVAPLALASIAAGVHGVMIEVHPRPEKALSDGPQSLHFKEFERLMMMMNGLHEYVKKNIRPGGRRDRA
jgi:3-deoxy-7-phosphoheptulonate synthase